MRIKPRLAINLLAVVALGIVTVGWVVLRLVGPGTVGDPMRVVADFASSGGVFTDQEVTYRGVLVGRVGALALNDDGVDIELVIDPEWRGDIPLDVVAKVQSKSAVGEQFVNLVPETPDGEVLADGDVIPRSSTQLPVDFQQLLKSLDSVLSDVPPEQSRRLIQNLASGLEGRGPDIAEILRSLSTLSDAFASVAPEQIRLLDNAPQAGAEFLRTKDEFSDAIRAADQVLTGIGDEPEELRELFASNDRFARDGIQLLARRGDDLAGGFDALADFIEFQLDQRQDIERLFTYLPGFLHAVEDASVPWRSPDGREFYRIRVGLVVDRKESSWPCKYKRPDAYERLPHVRKLRTALTTLDCIPPPKNDLTGLARSLVAALREWVADHPREVVARSGIGRDADWPRRSMKLPSGVGGEEGSDEPDGLGSPPPSNEASPSASHSPAGTVSPGST